MIPPADAGERVVWWHAYTTSSDDWGIGGMSAENDVFMEVDESRNAEKGEG
jgi:hypothetical protein